MFAIKPNKILMMLIIIFFTVGISLSAGNGNAKAQTLRLATSFGLPLGYWDGVQYGARVNYDGELLIEDTEYGVVNPDMWGNNCFNQIWGEDLIHSGIDLYRTDGLTTAGAEVTAIADGTVIWYSENFPGGVIIIEHNLPPDGQQKIYSLYGHLDASYVSEGDEVSRGQVIGTVVYDDWEGYYTPSHDDSHLHFEIRTFADGSNIYSNYPVCNRYFPGRGYTYPEHPNDFPNQDEHYVDPLAYINSKNTTLYMPFFIKQTENCVDGKSLIKNNGFEQGHAFWSELGTTIIYEKSQVSFPKPPLSGNWAAWFGGNINVNDALYQEIFIPPGMTMADLVYYYWMGTDENTTPAYDYLRVILRTQDGGFIRTVDTISDNSTKKSWIMRSLRLYNLQQYEGLTLRVSFEGTGNSTKPTSFLVDDVGLVMRCGGGSGTALKFENNSAIEIPEAENNSPKVVITPTFVVKPASTPQPYP